MGSGVQARADDLGEPNDSRTIEGEEYGVLGTMQEWGRDGEEEKMKSGEGGGKRKYAWGMAKERVLWKHSSHFPQIINVHCEWISYWNKQMKEVNLIEMTCYGNGREAHQLSGMGGSPNL